MASLPRVLAVTACLAVLAAVAAGCGGDESDSTSGDSGSTKTTASGKPDLSGQQGVMVTYGGPTKFAYEEAWIEPFNKETGATVTYDAPSDPARVKAMVQSGNVTWDLIDLDGATGGAGCGTLFRKRADMNVDMSEVDSQYVSDECGIPIILQAQTLLYNKAKYGDNPPTKVTDFLDTARFPGKRALFNYSIGGLEPLELASGTPPDKVYPYNFDVVKQAIDKLGDDLVLQNELAQQSEQLSSGNFDMCMCYTGRAAITPGISSDNVGVVWDGAWLAYDVLYAIEKSKVPELQAAFLNHVAKHETQSAFTERVPYSPATKGPKPEVKEAFKYWMPEYNEDKLTNAATVDYQYLGQPGVADEAQAKWTELTSG